MALDDGAVAADLLAEGVLVVEKLRAAAKAGDYFDADNYGKKAAGIWAQAQAHATLALVEQQRIANLIALEQPFSDGAGQTYPLRSWMPNERINAIDEALGTFA